MRALKWIGAVAVGIAVIVWLAFDTILLRLPGIIDGIRNPTGPNQEVHWQHGPETAEETPGRRPPNVVVIN